VTYLDPALDQAQLPVLADGTLQVLHTPASEGLPEQMVLAIQGATDAESFLYPIMDGMQAVVDAERRNLTLPVLTKAGIYGIHAYGGADLTAISAQLSLLGGKVVEQTGRSLEQEEVVDDSKRFATKVASHVSSASAALAGAIYSTSEVLSGGIKAVVDSSKQSKLMQPSSRVSVPGVVQAEVANATKATSNVAHLTGALVATLASAAGEVTKKVMPNGLVGDQEKSGRKSDAAILGEATVASSLQVLRSLHAANEKLTSDVKGGSAELLRHKYGDGVSSVWLDSFQMYDHVSASRVTKTGLAKCAGLSAAHAAAGKRNSAGGIFEPLRRALNADSSGEAICLGPQAASK